jgi:hypothetical protein
MANILFGLFNDTKNAGAAVGELKQKGYTKEISVLAYNKDYEQDEVYEIKHDVSDGASVGTTVGAVTGVLAGIFSGISSIIVPGVGILVGGPLVAALGLTGGVTGALSGGLLGGLVDLGINEPSASLYEKEIRMGQVLVGISTQPETEDEVRTILSKYNATEITVVHK